MGQKRPTRAKKNALRARAENTHRTAPHSPIHDASDAKRLVHELKVHQVELEMQNEELKSAACELDRSHAEYRSLYDDAPVGYLTLDARGNIRRANVAAGAILGADAARLI